MAARSHRQVGPRTPAPHGKTSEGLTTFLRLACAHETLKIDPSRRHLPTTAAGVRAVDSTVTILYARRPMGSLGGHVGRPSWGNRGRVIASAERRLGHRRPPPAAVPCTSFGIVTRSAPGEANSHTERGFRRRHQIRPRKHDRAPETRRPGYRHALRQSSRKTDRQLRSPRLLSSVWFDGCWSSPPTSPLASGFPEP